MPFRLPPSPSGRPWHRVIDTALPSPQDIVLEDTSPPLAFDSRYAVAAHSLVVLVSRAAK